ncbi:hypothetical protein ACI3L1_15695 [Deinococcus sp. SM5_A1]|uniref:hypothetical protein n=1 Tax=Deinococcus sp. SM5_A1 TaxID=3379094 RepID=UPI00385C05BB
MNATSRAATFSVAWAMILSAVLMLVAASVVQSAAALQRSAGSVTCGALLNVAERNVLTYGQRLLEVNAGVLTRHVTPDATAASMAPSAQGLADGWCSRDPDGTGAGRVRVYFTARLRCAAFGRRGTAGRGRDADGERGQVPLIDPSGTGLYGQTLRVAEVIPHRLCQLANRRRFCAGSGLRWIMQARRTRAAD